MKKIFARLFARKLVRWGAVILIVIIAGTLLFRRNNVVVYETATIARGSVVETVLATGQVKPKDSASLRFRTTGPIAKLYAEVGDRVSAGQILAVLDTGELSKKVTQAEADLVAAEVTVQNSQQDVTDQQTKSGQSLDVLYAAVPSSFNEILNWSEQAYANFVAFYDASGQLTSTIANNILISQYVIDANNAQVAAKTALTKLRTTLESFSPAATPAQIDAALVAIHAPLQQLHASLTALITAVASIPTGAINATTLETYKTQLAAARTNVNSAISEETDTATNIRDAKVQNSLNENSTMASERSAQASLEKARATLEIAKQNLNDAYLRAPISGTIAAKDKQIGELVTTADQVYYILGQGGLEVVANIPEVDITKISVGDAARIDLDAYADRDPFEVVVSEIDPAETIVDGIATYKVTFTFNEVDERIRSGMTANIIITTDERTDVLTVPQRALATKNGQRIVRQPPTQPNGEPTEVVVRTGLRGSDGTVELLEGLPEGATVIVGTKTK